MLFGKSEHYNDIEYLDQRDAQIQDFNKSILKQLNGYTNVLNIAVTLEEIM